MKANMYIKRQDREIYLFILKMYNIYLQKKINMIKLECIHKRGRDVMDQTKTYNSTEFQEQLIAETIEEVADILNDRGYNAINQIVGYLMSGDPGYISSHKEARNKITKFERTEILEVIVKKYLEK